MKTLLKKREPFEVQYRLQKEEAEVLLLSKGKLNYNSDGVFTGFIGTCVLLSQQIAPESKK